MNPSSTRRWLIAILATLGLLTAISAHAQIDTMAAVATPSSFITSWAIPPDDRSDAERQIIIPTVAASDTYNYHVDWGDGDTTGPHDSNASHIYTDVGETTRTYTVAITGEFPRIHFNGVGESANKIISIDQWGDNMWTSMQGAFWGCTNLRYNATDTPDLFHVGDMSQMFSGANVFNGNIGNWEVGNVGNMQSMFLDATV